MFNDTHASRTLRLTAGEHRALHTPAGSRWFAAHGDVRLTEPPRWLGERLVGIELVLDDGAGHVFEHGGWVGVHAASDCTLICEPPRSLTSRIAALWRMIQSGRAVRRPA